MKESISEEKRVSVLHLPLKAKWYEMQECGEKTEEYREITSYWLQRLYQWKPTNNREAKPIDRFIAPYICKHYMKLFWNDDYFDLIEPRPYTHVLFRYGYTKRYFISRILDIRVGRGKPEWGAPSDRPVFIIRHHLEPVG